MSTPAAAVPAAPPSASDASPAAQPPAAAPNGRLSVAQMIAEMEAAEGGDEAPAAEEDDAPETEPATEGEPEKPAEDADDEDGEDDGEEEKDEDSSSNIDEAKPEEDGDPADPVVAKRIAAIQKAEKRSLEQVNRARVEMQRDFDGQRAAFEREWTPKIEKYERVHQAIERASTDPLALAGELGWDADTKLYIAQMLHAEAKAEQGDPKFRDHALRVRREREANGKTGALEKQISALTERLERQEAERRVDYVAQRAEAAIGEKTPVLRHMMTKSPEHARERIRQATAYVRQEIGRDPDPADVITKLEEVERQELIARGIDPLAAIGVAKKQAVPAPTKNKTQVAGEKTTAKPSAVTAKPPQGARLSKAQLIRELEELDRKSAAPS